MNNKITIFQFFYKNIEIYCNENKYSKRYFKFTFLLLNFLFVLINLKQFEKLFNYKSLAFYNHYIKYCSNLKVFKRIINKKYMPYVSICLPVYNMENYIQKSILSILNQSFQNFEIIIVNDYSFDKTRDIVIEMQKKDNRIKLINHSQNLGVYTSRVDGILASIGKYIILMDPDDMLLNPKILEELYNYNLKYNLDIIEYTVFCYKEKYNILKYIKQYYHFHYLKKNIIYQPELSDIYFYHPLNSSYSKVQCRTIWNKIIRRKILLNSILYIGEDYYNKFFITAEDTLINLISLHFSQNYSNINIPGYMYNIREISMTHGKSSKKKKIIFCYNHLLYIKKFYYFIKNFNKNIYYFYYELKEISKILLKLLKISRNHTSEINIFFKKIFNDKYISNKIKLDIKNLLSFK